MATITNFDCQFDNTNMTNSVVIGRSGSTDDLGRLISSKDIKLDSKVGMGLKMDEAKLANYISLLGWTNVFVDDDGNEL